MVTAIKRGTSKAGTSCDQSLESQVKLSPSMLAVLPSVREAEAYLVQQIGGESEQIKRIRPQLEVALGQLRGSLRQDKAVVISRQQILEQLAYKLSSSLSGLREVINASGVVLHTNLGRAPLGSELFRRTLACLSGAVNLEYDLLKGERGFRATGVEVLLSQLAGAEDGLVSNNNAAAVLLLLTALASQAEVIVSRGELVEIGGGFRVPEIMQQSGVKLVEVGTTNRTCLGDYAQAITSRTVALLKVHRSNFTMGGFVEEVPLSELARLASKQRVSLWCDQGSASFYRFRQPELKKMETPMELLKMGVQVLTFSADKLLGSVQAGLVVGDKKSIARMRAHPLFRSLRCDKVRLALLEQTLLDSLSPKTFPEKNPTTAFLERTPDELHSLAKALLNLLGQLEKKGLHCQLLQTESLVGAGAAPDIKLPSLALSLVLKNMSADKLTQRLRTARVPIIARQQKGQVWLDMRTLSEAQLPIIAETLTKITMDFAQSLTPPAKLSD